MKKYIPLLLFLTIFALAAHQDWNKGKANGAKMLVSKELHVCINHQKQIPSDFQKYFEYKFDDIPPFPSMPENYAYTVPANTKKKTMDVNEFVCSSKNVHTQVDSIPIVRAKVLHKDVRRVYPDVLGQAGFIHPDRQVFVVVSKTFGDVPRRRGISKNPIVFNLYDAETGELYGVGYKGEAADVELPVKGK